MVKIEFHDPSGVLEVTQPFAPRVDTLAGKRIGFVSNEQWQAFRMLPLLRDLLKADFPTAELLPDGRDGKAGQAERGRRRHRRQRGLRVLRHCLRPCCREDRNAGHPHRHADADGFRRCHEKCGIGAGHGPRCRDGDVSDRHVPAGQ